jgi:hypothetical protein
MLREKLKKKKAIKNTSKTKEIAIKKLNTKFDIEMIEIRG